MKIKYSKIIPFKGFFMINLFGTLFIREENKGKKISKTDLNHEAIHTEQMKELGYIFFYIWYFIEWLLQLLFHGKEAYYWISFERESFDNEKNYKYLNTRKRYNWLKYYG